MISWGKTCPSPASHRIRLPGTRLLHSSWWSGWMARSSPGTMKNHGWSRCGRMSADSSMNSSWAAMVLNTSLWTSAAESPISLARTSSRPRANNAARAEAMASGSPARLMRPSSTSRFTSGLPATWTGARPTPALIARGWRAARRTPTALPIECPTYAKCSIPSRWTISHVSSAMRESVGSDVTPSAATMPPEVEQDVPVPVHHVDDRLEERRRQDEPVAPHDHRPFPVAQIVVVKVVLVDGHARHVTPLLCAVSWRRPTPSAFLLP